MKALVLSVVRFGLSVAEWLGWKKPFCSQSSIAFVGAPILSQYRPRWWSLRSLTIPLFPTFLALVAKGASVNPELTAASS